jgi:hypothetical protein
MTDTITDSKNSDDNKSFFSNIPWTYIIMGVIVVIIALSIKLVIDAIGKIGQPIIEAFGSVAKTTANVINNCLPQYDCTKIENCDQCNTTTGCSCTPDQKNCQIISGRNAGEGGFFTPSCGLGIGFILYGLASLFLGVLPIIAGWKASPAVEATAKAEGKPSKEVVKELTDESRAEIDKQIEEHEKTTGEKTSPETRKLIEKVVAESKLADRQHKAAEKLPSTEDKTTMQKEAATRYENKQNEINEEKEKLSDEEKATVDKVTEENKPKFEEEEEPIE